MKTNLYQIFDRVADVVTGPIIVANRDAAAIRIVAEVFADNNPNNQLAKHPMDYELRKIGEQDQNTGTLTAVTVANIYSGAQWIREQARAAEASAEQLADDSAAL